ncbi:MAG: hypothetical protein NTV88_02880 [Candidatus Micrarchaeota archaeon]|nr:hypothetical protein [Candidatus Micrarchaeota archaeon]
MKNLKKIPTDTLEHGSARKPVRAFLNRSLKSVSRGVLYTGTALFLTWVALTSSASTTQAQTKSITQKIEILQENAKINTNDIKNVEINNGYLYFKSNGNDFQTSFAAALEKIGSTDSIKVDDNWIVVFGKKGIADVTLNETSSDQQYVFSSEPMRSYYYDKKNRMTIAADEYGIMLIHPLGRMNIFFEQLGEMLKKEIKTSTDVKVLQDPENANWAIISFAGNPTLKIYGDLRDPNGTIIDYISKQLGSGN